MELLTHKYKFLLAEQVNESISASTNDSYHLVGAKLDEFGSVIPAPEESVFESEYQIHDEMLFGKLIKPEDVSYMIHNNEWVSGTKYDMYDDKDVDLPTKKFFVVASQDDGSYGVFKCIYKNPISDPASVYKPLVNQVSPTDEIYITGDGYHWKYMFSIDSVTYNKFSNTNYVPVKIDSSVVSSSVPGTIDAIITTNVGAQYNNYAYGTIRRASYDNNILKFSIISDDVFTVKTYDIIYTSNGTFSDGEDVNITVPGETSVQGSIYKTGLSSISLEIDSNTESITQSTVVSNSNPIEVDKGGVTAEVVQIREENLPKLSNDANFYNGSVFYIRSGTGSGQIRTVSSYDILGNDRVITIDEAFGTLPDSTSSFSILPKISISGDGSGAIALPEIEPTANSISDVRIINRGSGYTFSDAVVSGNTGIISANGDPVIADSAVLRPVISPKNGHGYDPVKELYGSNVGVSVKFTDDEVLDNVSFSKVAMIRNLLLSDIKLTLSSLVSGEFTVGETVQQDNVNAEGEVSNIDLDSNILTLTNVFGNFEVSANNFLIGTSANSEIIDINRNNETFNNEIILSISPIVSGFTVGETITQKNSSAKGTIIKESSTSLNIVQIYGEFTTNLNDEVIGDTSAARAIVTDKTERQTVDNSGDIVYIENSSQISRSATTSEQIKLILTF